MSARVNKLIAEETTTKQYSDDSRTIQARFDRLAGGLKPGSVASLCSPSYKDQLAATRRSLRC